MNNSISIIIPTLNEAEGVDALLLHLDAACGSDLIKEVIIADGGSKDATCDIAAGTETKNFPVVIISAKKGRASQMNRGAQTAKGDILYFLHADSFPPENFDAHILKAIEENHLAGCFRLRFDESHILLRISQWFTRFNFQLCRGGDQSLFIRKEVFESLGGFNEAYTIYEDGDLHGRIYTRRIPFKVMTPPITTSGRRYRKNGFWRLQYHFTRVHLMYRLGYGPRDLYAYYLRNISQI